MITVQATTDKGVRRIPVCATVPHIAIGRACRLLRRAGYQIHNICILGGSA